MSPGSIVQAASGGNPGAYGEFTDVTDHFNSWVNYHRMTFTYDTAVSGPLTNLRMGMDAKYISGWLSAGATPQLCFMVLQGGRSWLNGLESLQAGWTHYERTLVATDFRNPQLGETGNPNFVNGGVITFGFLMRGAWDFSPPQVTVGGIDNFFATNQPVPEPASLLVLGAGLAWIRCRRRATP